MFFGQPVNVARYDQQKFPVFEQLIEKQLSFFWRPEEIDVSKDHLDFSNLSVHEQHIFLSNLKYQTLLLCRMPTDTTRLKRPSLTVKLNIRIKTKYKYEATD